MHAVILTLMQTFLFITLKKKQLNNSLIIVMRLSLFSMAQMDNCSGFLFCEHYYFSFGTTSHIVFCHSLVFLCFVVLYIIICVLNVVLLLYICLL